MLAPLRWAAWIAGASARLVGHMIATNATMLLALGALLLAGARSLARREDRNFACDDLGGVLLVAGAWVGAAAPLTVLTTFPAMRYIDSAAILVPAIPLVLTIAMLAAMRDSAPRG